jgi:hypothetical protein
VKYAVGLALAIPAVAVLAVVRFLARYPSGEDYIPYTSPAPRRARRAAAQEQAQEPGTGYYGPPYVGAWP